MKVGAFPRVRGHERGSTPRRSTRVALALIVGILAAGLILSAGELGCPPGYVLARGHVPDLTIYQATCIGVEAGALRTTSPRVTWAKRRAAGLGRPFVAGEQHSTPSDRDSLPVPPDRAWTGLQ